MNLTRRLRNLAPKDKMSFWYICQIFQEVIVRFVFFCYFFSKKVKRRANNQRIKQL